MQMRFVFRILIKVAVVSAFVIVLAVATLTAYGYKYDLEANKLQPTGIIFLNGSYKDLRVLLDGQEISRSLPTRILGVREGFHALEVRKDGFLPWSLHVTVTGGLVTQVPFIFLLEEHPEKRFERLFSFSRLFSSSVALVGASMEEYVLQTPAETYFHVDRFSKKKTKMTLPKTLLSPVFVVPEHRGYGFTDTHGYRQFSFNRGKISLSSAENFPYASKGLRFLQFSSDFSEFLFVRGGELVGISRIDGKEKFFTRLAGQIRNVAWFYDTHHFLIHIENELQFCDEYFANCTTLMELTESDSFAVDSEGVYVLKVQDQSLHYLRLFTGENTFLSYIFSEQVSL